MSTSNRSGLFSRFLDGLVAARERQARLYMSGYMDLIEANRETDKTAKR